MEERIAFVKTGWSEEYKGGPVSGRFAYEEDYHERFNFLLGPDNCFYGYLPPIGEHYRPPQPKNRQGWLVIFVAARHGNGPLTVVGWYRNATFTKEYQSRPEYAAGLDDFPTDANEDHFVCCVHAQEAHLIQAQDREIEIPGTRFRRPSIIYVRGTSHKDEWREELATLAEQIVTTPTSEAPPPQPSFPDSSHRKRVEEASIKEAISYLEAAGYRVTDRQKDNCGYDLLAKRSRPPKELHVEVKGTSKKTKHFYISRNEMHYIPHLKWRLLIVTDALGTPQVSLLSEKEVNKTFEFDPLVWEARLKK